ncbi:MAG TPA: hypothetical protein VJ577_18625 [Burkholderiaceae bacterium]|nr:hypothetical protein [Burkholderiaceae bacterium]
MNAINFPFGNAIEFRFRSSPARTAPENVALPGGKNGLALRPSQFALRNEETEQS